MCKSFDEVCPLALFEEWKGGGFWCLRREEFGPITIEVILMHLAKEETPGPGDKPVACASNQPERSPLAAWRHRRFPV